MSDEALREELRMAIANFRLHIERMHTRMPAMECDMCMARLRRVQKAQQALEGTWR